MPSVLLVAILAVVAARLTGGRFERITRSGVRWPWLAVVGVALQLIPTFGTVGSWATLLLACSFGLVIAFGLVNLRRSGLALVLVGTALNFVVITVNGGMPVSGTALVASGDSGQRGPLARGEGGAKYHLAGPDDVLMPLADVVVLPPPVGEVVSVGDLAIDAGLAWFLFAAMHARGTPRRKEVAPAGKEQLEARPGAD